ncbi:TolC family protein [Flavobacteriales bacterium]|jgi:outer membrane protein|nr:TolC family protein [Flavobacteriales bacterium]|tara:strand:- start:1671 stop:2999 length:1329 start_codon:yes stop_codon:yes gene_type:complete
MGKITSKIFISFLLLTITSNVIAQETLTLKECIERAIEKNISIKNSTLDLLNSSENKKIAIGNFIPNFNISGNHSWNTGLTQNITTGLLENQTTENSSVNMSVGVNLFNGLANIRRLHRANLDLLAKKYQLNDMKEDISLLIANSYLQILFNKEQLEVQMSQLDIAKKELKIAQTKFTNGVIPKGDLFEIEANLAKSEQSLVIAENNYFISKISLAQLLMIDDYSNFEIADENYDIPETNILGKSAIEIINESVKHRNDIKLAETNLRIAIKDEKISRSSLIPSISAYYSYNSRVIIDAPTSLKNQFDLNAGESIGLQINIPVINGFTTRSNIKKSQLNVLRSRNFLDQARLDLENTINQSLNDAKGAMKAYEAAKKTELARKTAYNYAKERFENGAMNGINFFQAQQLFESSQSDLIKAKYDYIFKIKVLEFYFGMDDFSL